MKNNQPEIQSRFFHLFVTVPTEKAGNIYDRNFTLGVVAPSLEEAVSRVKEIYPDVVIWSVQHRGPIHLGIVEIKNLHGLHDEDQVK